MYDLNSLDPAGFANLTKNRYEAISTADGELRTTERPANKLANMLHPSRQYMKITDITEHGSNCKSYILRPDTDKTTACAYFASGQYLTVFEKIDDKVISRPYSISSSPKEALEGSYRLTIKATGNGILSNYILNNWQIGSCVTVSDPTGNFTYEPLRDAEHIIGVAGGSGITPFISLAKAIADGDEDCSLTLLYGIRDEKDIIFKEELDALVSDKIKVIYIISNEEKGYITAETISRYTGEAPYSLFVCGPVQLYEHINREADKLNIRRKFIRCEIHEPTIAEKDSKEVNITLIRRGEKTSVRGMTCDTILRTLENNGIAAPSRCRSGECGFCHSRLISGDIYIPNGYDKRRQADSHYGFIHPCCTYPLGDIEIEISASK